jgi:glycosyltransferase involved in cell wall biosynthesis
MKISIITINYNDKVGLEKTIQSVNSQTNKDFEYVVIDGNSTDGSKELIEENSSSIHYWISEADSGIYNAMNKGIHAAKGDYLLFLNSGDHLVDEHAIQKVADAIDGSKDLYYGDAIFKREKGHELVTYPDKLTLHFFTYNSLCHQASFIKRTLFDEIFYYNEELRIISDWEFMVYAVCIKNISYQHLNIAVSYYDFEGVSSRPDSKSKIDAETAFVMNKFFPAFVDDYKYLDDLTSKNVRNMLHIKQFPFAWTLLKGLSKILLLFLPKQKK